MKLDIFTHEAATSDSYAMIIIVSYTIVFSNSNLFIASLYIDFKDRNCATFQSG